MRAVFKLRGRVVAGALAALLASAGAAGAVAFGSSSTPMTVSGYGSTGKGYGDWSAVRSGVENIVSRDNSAYYKFSDADNHTVYFGLDTFVQIGGTVGVDPKLAYSSHDNVSNSSSWTAFRSRASSTFTALFSNVGTTVTGRHQLCLDIPVRVDPCGAEVKKILYP